MSTIVGYFLFFCVAFCFSCGNRNGNANAAKPSSRLEIDDEWFERWFLFCTVFFFFVHFNIRIICVHICHTSIGNGRSAIYSYLRVEPFIHFLFSVFSLAHSIPFSARPLSAVSHSLHRWQKPNHSESAWNWRMDIGRKKGKERCRVEMNGKLFSENVSNNYCRLFRTNTGISVVAKSTR